jgi:hypothetical protein
MGEREFGSGVAKSFVSGRRGPVKIGICVRRSISRKRKRLSNFKEMFTELCPRVSMAARRRKTATYQGNTDMGVIAFDTKIPVLLSSYCTSGLSYE